MKKIKRIIIALMMFFVVVSCLLYFYTLHINLKLMLLSCITSITFTVIYLYLLNFKMYRYWKEKIPIYLFVVYAGYILRLLYATLVDLSNQTIIFLIVIPFFLSGLTITIILYVFKEKYKN